MRQLFLRHLVQMQIVPTDAEPRIPIHVSVYPVLKRLVVLAWLNKILQLQLLKLTRPQDEVARCNFVAKCLAQLSNTKRKLAPHGGLYVEKVYENSLRSLRSEIGECVGV